MWRSIKSLDTFVKARTEHLVRKRTICGATITIISGIIMVALFLSEMSIFFQRKEEHHVEIDSTPSEEDISIYLDITFFHLSCDSAFPAIDRMLELVCWNLYGILVYFLLAGAAVIFVGAEIHPEVQDNKGHLYEEARVHLARHPWPPAGIFSQQGGGRAHTGCTMSGSVDVKKVAGNLHVVPDVFSSNSRSFVRTLSLDSLLHYNASHRINHLAFGPSFPGQRYPLDGDTKVVQEGAAQFQYYAQVVPTTYEPMYVGTRDSAQFSVTEFTASSDPKSSYVAPPGLVVRYDFAPFRVRVSESRETILQFLTRVCAILGGVFTVSGLIDTLVHRGMEVMNKMD